MKFKFSLCLGNFLIILTTKNIPKHFFGCSINKPQQACRTSFILIETNVLIAIFQTKPLQNHQLLIIAVTIEPVKVNTEISGSILRQRTRCIPLTIIGPPGTTSGHARGAADAAGWEQSPIQETHLTGPSIVAAQCGVTKRRPMV